MIIASTSILRAVYNVMPNLTFLSGLEMLGEMGLIFRLAQLYMYVCVYIYTYIYIYIYIYRERERER